MIDANNKKSALARLRRLEGQVAAIGRMIDEERYCVDVLLQIAAARGALGKLGELVLEAHIRTCVQDAFEGEDDAARDDKICELLDVFARYGGIGSP